MKSILNRQLMLTGISFLLSLLIIIPNLRSQHNVPLDQWVRDYAEDLSRPDWRKYMAKYGWDSNYENHEKFRKAYRNTNAEVLRSVTDGTYVMAWMKVSAYWDGNVEDIELRESTPTGRKIEWEEVWYFNVIDGKFGGKWDIIVDTSMRMRSAGVRCLPEKFN